MNFCYVNLLRDMDSDANYHQNASNAFVVASQLAPTIAAIPGEKVVMAHSLGNMVVSSMIQDYGLQVSKYIMCNSAVPAEAYDLSPSLRMSQLVHPDWEAYPTNSWTASWHTLFAEEPNDDRKSLGWPGRFANVTQYAVNFYSTGDEVLELAVDNNVDVLTGITSSFAHHSWHKQELFKGRGFGVGMGCTDWSGWNIEENWLGMKKNICRTSAANDRCRFQDKYRVLLLSFKHEPAVDSTSDTRGPSGAWHSGIGGGNWCNRPLVSSRPRK